MSTRSETFGRLLKGAIGSIAAYEGKTAPAIEDDLGAQIGLAGSALQRYKAGNLPPEPRTVEIIATAAVQRGYLGRAWLQPFLQAVRYPNPEALITRLVGEAPVSAAAAAPPSGTLTFLFTDIVGSTRIWEEHPTAMQRALARHDAILRDAVRDQRGTLIKSTGDGLLVAFATASQALRAALVAQRMLLAEPWSAGGLPLPIQARMALHTGATEERAGDYFGAPLNRAARLSTVGSGGQILLSLATAELVRDQLPDDVRLQDLGEHRLKDLTRPERIFQVCAPGLPADFPPLKTLDAYRHNLPAQATALIGREREIEAATDLLLEPGVRLLTLTGPGGIGKTRLALQAAGELLDTFADGVWFIGLAPISDPHLVANAIAAALGVRERGDRTLDAQLKVYLRDKELLLLLDNFEQVAEAASLLAELLAAAAKLKILVTSRAPLHLYGEREYTVPPLTLPERTPPTPLERLTQYEAVRLFIERSQAVRADFAVTAANAPIIAEICYRLDGLPLAIELAAARSKIFAPQAILSRLDRRLATLTGGARDLPARQQTLRGAIDWSYILLDAAEQELFARLGVFVGGCTVAAAEAVLAADGDVLIDALDGLTSLLDKSLVRQAEGPNGEPRFVMLETIREYALERLAAGGAEEPVRRAHAEFFLALAEEAEPELRRGQQQLEYLRRLEIEHDNLRTALNWALAHDDPSIALRLAGALWRFWLIRSYHKEGHRWLEAALVRAEGRPELQGSPWRARALLGFAHLCLTAGDFAREEESAQEALAIYRALGDRAGMGYALFLLMDRPYFSGDKATARTRLEEGLAYYQAEEDSWGIGLCLHCMGVIAREQGDYSAAHEMLEQSVVLLREVGDRFWMGFPLYELAMEAWVRGDTARARALNEESLTTMRELGSKAELPGVLGSKIDMALSQGDYASAQALAEEALAVRREFDPDALAWQMERLGRIACLQGDLATARAHFEYALQQVQAREDQPAIAALEARLSRLAFHEGDLERAAALLERSLPVYTQGRISSYWELPTVLAQSGDVARAQGDLKRAVECYRQSLMALSQRGAVVGVAESLEGLAKVALTQEQPERAARLLGAASVLRERIGAPVAPVDRAEYERSLATARGALSETGFDAAWAAGQALPPDQAIAEAMAGADHPGQREEHIQVEG